MDNVTYTGPFIWPEHNRPPEQNFSKAIEALREVLDIYDPNQEVTIDLYITERMLDKVYKELRAQCINADADTEKEPNSTVSMNIPRRKGLINLKHNGQ